MKKTAAILLALLLVFSNAVAVLGGTQEQQKEFVSADNQAQAIFLEGELYGVSALPELNIVSYEDSGLPATVMDFSEEDSSLPPEETEETESGQETEPDSSAAESEETGTEVTSDSSVSTETEKAPVLNVLPSTISPSASPSSSQVQAPKAAVNSPAAAPAKETGVRGFVKRLYSNILSRGANEQEIAYYVDGMTGSGKETAAQVIYNFLNSPEFKGKNLTNEEYVRVLYTTILDRQPDKSGLEYYSNELRYSATRNNVLGSFVASPEFAAICESYGVTPGSITPYSVADRNPGSANFARRLYVDALGRSSVSDDEIEYRTSLLVNGEISAAQFLYDVLNSQEFKNRNLSDSAYITVLYQTVLGRYPDASGLAYYEKELASGVTRNALLNNFVYSPEFTSICQQYNVPQGQINFTNVVDIHPALASFVIRQYTSLLGRKVNQVGDVEVEHRVNSLLGGASAALLSYDLICSTEFKNRNLSDDEYISVLYQSLLGRYPDNGGKRYYQDILANGGSRELIFQNFIYSPEFAQICANYGMQVGTVDIANIVSPKDNTTLEHGVDVSKHQGNIDWQQVKNAGYTFAIIRATTYENGVCIVDPYFVQNIKGAKNAGIKVGAYCYTYSYSIENGVAKEVNVLLSALATVEKQGYKLEYPVFWDVEGNKYTNQASRDDITKLALYALDTLRSAGYYSALYTYTNFANTRLYMDRFSGYDFWVAQYGARVTYTGAYTMWQYSSTGRVAGISGNVDLNYSYKDYASIIKNGKWNKW